MTADEFERAYAERSGVTVAELRENDQVVRPCDCGEERNCEGWQMVTKAVYDRRVPLMGMEDSKQLIGRA